MTRGLVAAVVGVLFYSAGRTFTEDVIDAWQVALDDLADGDDILPAARFLSRQAAFVTAADLFQFVSNSRSRSKAASQGRHPDSCQCSGTGWVDSHRDDRGYSYVRRCPGPSGDEREDRPAPLPPGLAATLQRATETLFESPEDRDQ